MARQSLDNASMKAWSERVDKELMERLRWHKKYSKAFSESDGAVPTTSDPQADTIRRYVKRQLNAPPPVPTPPKTRMSDQIKADRKKQEELETKKVDIDKLFQDMRPASRHTKALLYKGFSKIGEGRHSYLEARKSTGPDEKYKFPLTGNWEYGWKINEEIDEYRAPTHGRSHIIKESFYRNNGVSLL